jgi:ferredoxin-NADP reductase/MOSC domain-containing protein YiiM
VLVYQIQSHRYWEEFLGRDDIGYGQFGENLTVDGMGDDEVCIGDRYRIGEAEFEVTQPRVTCYRVGLRMNEPRMPALLVAHHRPGFYMRVITEGRIGAGDEIVKTRTGPEAISVADIDALLYLGHPDATKVQSALRIPALSPGWQQSFRDLVDGSAGTGGIAAGDAPAWSGFRPLKVTHIVPESPTVSSIYLTATDGNPLPAARGGQYLTLRIPGNAVRNYSLSSPPGADAYRISVKRLPQGPVSTYLTQTLHSGDVLDAGAPRGDFVLDHGDADRPVLLLSAGIGITPVLSILHELAARSSTREVWWIHGDRGPGEPPLAAEAHTLIKKLPNAKEFLFFSPRHITEASLSSLAVPGAACAYVCGPTSFMDDMRTALTAIGVDAARIHMELFGALGAINPGLVASGTGRPPHQPPGPPGTGPLVTFARSNISARFPSSGRHVLEFAESCDVPTRWSCRTGVCQTCITPLLSGDISYNPEPLDPPTDGRVLICCARPETDIVLDM